MIDQNLEKPRKNGFQNYIIKFKGYKRTTPLVLPAPLDMMISMLGAFIAIGLLGILVLVYGLPMIAAPLGASAVLVFGAPDAPLSQPRNVILGHTLSAIVGVSIYRGFGLTWWSLALGVALAILVMALARSTHPPGGATALLAILSAAEPGYIFSPMLTGSLVLVLIGVLVNNLSPNRSYPRYWY